MNGLRVTTWSQTKNSAWPTLKQQGPLSGDKLQMPSSETNKLAIVMPAYKARFLRQALESIAQQTDKRFTVYVGDDASPDDIKEI